MKTEWIDNNEQCTMNNVQWKKVKLGDCCESELGKTLDEGRNTGLYRPYLCALNVLWGKIDLSTIKKMRIEDSELERYLVKKGDLLVCEGGEIGRCAIWEYDDVIYYQNALHRVRFYEGYDARFFMYLLCHYNDLKLIEQYGKGLTIKHLNQTAFRNIPVSIPPLPVQRRIAAILSSADKVIASTQKVIDKLKQIKQGMMDDLLKPKYGWRMVKLGECCEDIFSGRNTKRNDFGKYIVFGSTGPAVRLRSTYGLKRLPSTMMASGRTFSWSRARCMARKLALRMLILSISSGVTMPTAQAMASRSMMARSSWRLRSVSCFESFSSSFW